VILVAKSMFTLGMNACKRKKSIVFDFATRIESGHEAWNSHISTDDQTISRMYGHVLGVSGRRENEP